MVLPHPHNNAVRRTSYCVHLAEQKSCPFRENGRQSWDLNPSPSVLKACLATLPGSASFPGGLVGNLVRRSGSKSCPACGNSTCKGPEARGTKSKPAWPKAEMASKRTEARSWPCRRRAQLGLPPSGSPETCPAGQSLSPDVVLFLPPSRLSTLVRSPTAAWSASSASPHAPAWVAISSASTAGCSRPPCSPARVCLP